MLKPDHKVVIAYTTTNVIGVTTVNVKYPLFLNSFNPVQKSTLFGTANSIKGLEVVV